MAINHKPKINLYNYIECEAMDRIQQAKYALYVNDLLFSESQSRSGVIQRTKLASEII